MPVKLYACARLFLIFKYFLQMRMQKQTLAGKASTLTSHRRLPKTVHSGHLLSQRQEVATARSLDAGASGNQNSLTWQIVPLSPLSPARMGQVNIKVKVDTVTDVVMSSVVLNLSWCLSLTNLSLSLSE